MFSISMSWEFIIIFHMELVLRTSIPTDRNGITRVGFGLHWPLWHMWKRVLASVDIQILLRTKTSPLVRLLQNIAMQKDSHNCLISHFQILHTSSSFHSCLRQIHCGEQIQNGPPHYLSSNIQKYPSCYANPHPSTSCTKQYGPSEDSHHIPNKS